MKEHPFTDFLNSKGGTWNVNQGSLTTSTAGEESSLNTSTKFQDVSC